MENTAFTPVISADAITSLTNTISGNISAIAPQLLGLAAVIIVPVVIFKLIKKFKNA